MFSGGSLCYGGGDEQVAQAMTNVKNAAQDQVDAAREQLYQVFSQQMPSFPWPMAGAAVVTGKDVMNGGRPPARDPITTFTSGLRSGQNTACIFGPDVIQ